MNSNLFPQLSRFLVFWLTQGLVLKQIAVKAGSYFNILLYPLFILLLPFQLATPWLVMLGFSIGLMVDFFYGNIGVHASTGAFLGWIRGFVFFAFEPRAGYSGKEPIASPAHFSWRWFAPLTAIYLFLACFWYFSVDYFTFYYFSSILLKTLAAWGLTMIFVFLYVLAFNPKQ